MIKIFPIHKNILDLGEYFLRLKTLTVYKNQSTSYYFSNPIFKGLYKYFTYLLGRTYLKNEKNYSNSFSHWHLKGTYIFGKNVCLSPINVKPIGPKIVSHMTPKKVYGKSELKNFALKKFTFKLLEIHSKIWKIQIFEIFTKCRRNFSFTKHGGLKTTFHFKAKICT